MNDPPLDENVRWRMQGIRSEIDQDLENVSASARRMVDWKHYVKTYPWVCLGTAAALGYLMVPKRSTTRCVDLATLTKAASTGHLVVEPPRSASRGMIAMILATGARMAVHGVIGLLAQGSARALGLSEEAAPRRLSAFNGAPSGCDGAPNDAARRR